MSSNVFIDEIASEYQISADQVSLLTVAVNIGFTVSATFAAIAQLPDLYSPATLVSAGGLGCAVSAALLASGIPFWALALTRFATGASLSLVYPPLMRCVSGWFLGKGRGLALGCIIGSLTVGIALPNLFKAAFSSIPWRSVILGTSAVPLLGSVLALGLQDGPHVRRAMRFSIAGVSRVLRSRSWHLVTLSYVSHNVELFGGWAWMDAFLEDMLSKDGHGTDVASIAAFVVVAAGGLGAVLGGMLSDRLGRRTLIALAHVLSGVLIACLPSVGQYAPAWVLLSLAVVWGMAVVADSAQYSALIADVFAEQELLGTALALSLALGFFSTAVGVYVVPVLVAWGSWGGAFPCLAIGPLVGLIAIALV